MVNAPIDMETSQSIYFANQVIGFYMMETIAFGLKDTLREEILAGRNFGGSVDATNPEQFGRIYFAGLTEKFRGINFGGSRKNLYLAGINFGGFPE